MGAIILSKLKKIKYTADLEEGESAFIKVVTKTDGYSCSDIAHVMSDAAMGPVRDLGMALVDMSKYSSADAIPPVNADHIKQALKNIKPSLSKEKQARFKDWNSKFGSQMTRRRKPKADQKSNKKSGWF